MQYLANLFTAGDTEPVATALKRLIALRCYKRSQIVDKNPNQEILIEAGLTVDQVEEMYRYLALADYEDRFVIPTHHPELAKPVYAEQGGCGFDFGEGCSGSRSSFTFFPARRTDRLTIPIKFTEREK